MSTLNVVCLKLVRWTGWLLLPVVIGFLVTGYIMSGQFGFGRWLDEQRGLTLHRLLHWPLLVLVLAHSVPAVYLALQRWRWIRSRPHP